ncbi:MAG: FtsX-like permease family protein [Bacteroidota bacterium]
MLRNYFLTAIRNLWRYKTFSAINIICLSVSMGVCFLLIQLMGFHLRFDRFHEKKDQLYRIGSYDLSTEDWFNNYYATLPLALQPHLEAHLKEGEVMLPIIHMGGEVVVREDSTDEERYVGDVLMSNAQFFDIFSFPLVKGDPSDLSKPYHIFLTEDNAKSLFGEEDPIGKAIWSGHDSTYYRVSGIVKDLPKQSHIQFDAIASIGGYRVRTPDGRIDYLQMAYKDWDWRSGYLYFYSPDPGFEDRLHAAIPSIQQVHFDGEEKMKFHVQQMADVHLIGAPQSHFTKREIYNPFPWFIPYIALFIGLLVIGSALFNYINLTLARSFTRLKEMGVRKVVGASKRQIQFQLICESMVLAFFAFLVALTLLQFLIPLFYESGLPENIFLLDESPDIFLWFVLFAILAGLVGGFFPALFYGRIKPIIILRGMENNKLLAKIGWRKALIVLQFGLSIIWFASGALLFGQVRYLVTKDHGFTPENQVIVPINPEDVPKARSMVTEFPELTEICFSSSTPGSAARADWQSWRPGTEDTVNLFFMSADQAFIPQMGIEMMAGKNFPEELSGQSQSFAILSRLAVRDMHFDTPEDAIGQPIMLIEGDSSYMLTVIGVVKDFHNKEITMPPSPVVMVYQPKRFYNALVKAETENPGELLGKIFSYWNEGRKRYYGVRYLDEKIAQSYIAMSVILNVVGFVALLSTIIACLGLLGMAVFTVQHRTKEMGIRRVLGASFGQLSYQLSRNFLSLLLISIVVALPVVYFLNEIWLSQITYRLPYSGVVIGASALIMLMTGLATILPMTIKVARTNPADVLRDE